MKDLVSYILTQIVDYPDEISFDESTDESGAQIITVSVHPDDMGKVIGKGGKIISAIRELVKVKAVRQGVRVRLILKDPDQTDQPDQSPPPESPPQTS